MLYRYSFLIIAGVFNKIESYLFDNKLSALDIVSTLSDKPNFSDFFKIPLSFVIK